MNGVDCNLPNTNSFATDITCLKTDFGYSMRLEHEDDLTNTQ